MTNTALPLFVTANPHYVRLGGRPAVERLVDAFYRAMDNLPEAATIRALHAPDLADTKRVLVTYLCEWMGGPKDYSASRGNPMLRRRHHPFPIDAAARDAWMACMRAALGESCADASLRAELDAAFWKIADFIRNTEGDGSSRPHPGRPREHGHAHAHGPGDDHGHGADRPPPMHGSSQPAGGTAPIPQTPSFSRSQP